MSSDTTHPSVDGIEAVGALAEPVRRRLYEYVAVAPGPVGRDEASRALGIGRPLAAFHLDRLVRDGLLVADYRRLTGRTGPGAGRPAKVYRRAPGEIAVSLPARRYDIVAAVFADALQALDPAGPADALLEAARTRGRRVGSAVRAGGGSDGVDAASLVEALAGLGFEPTREAGTIRLRNCPFEALSRDHRDLTCPANLAFLEGLVVGVGSDAEARLDPAPGRCCVVIERVGERT